MNVGEGTAMLVGWALMAVVMLALWHRQRSTRNAGVVDVAWAFGTAAMIPWLAYAADGDPARRALIAVLGAVWGIRLGVHLLRRVGSEAEDGRYRYMRKSLAERAQPVFFLFFQVQALWTLLFAIAPWAAASSGRDGLGWWDALGVAVWLIAMLGEAVADRQLAVFRANPSNLRQVCDSGLWRYSRHPNYFFEWLHWFAYVAIAVGSPYWWVALAGVAMTYVFLTRLTGIPYTEMQAIRSRGDAYRHYQQTTNAFIPWPPASQTEEI